MGASVDIGLVLARSPYYIEINEANQTATRIELFIWVEGDTEPTIPTYSLSKKIPSSNQTNTIYNISPYLREYFKFYGSSPNNGNIQNIKPEVDTYCYLRVKLYYTAGSETLLDEYTGISTDGYGYYTDGLNYSFTERILLTNLNYVNPVRNTPIAYTYPCDIDVEKIGTVTLFIDADNDYKIKYTEIGTGDFYEQTIDQAPLVNVQKTIYPTKGNIWQLYINDELYFTYVFQLQCECKYDVITVDFINRFGTWQREFFYKASNETFEMSNNQYKLNPSKLDYNLYEGQDKTFNTNGRISIKANTGWVEEAYKAIIQELMLSETVRVNEQPAMLKTKSVEKYNSINTKQINYAMEFELAYDIINTVN